MPIRILHTSDWHLGRDLAEVDRRADFKSFLDWMIDLLDARSPDVLLVAGDVFDTSLPSNDAQRLWYEFLRRAADTPVRAVVVTAGNHDSPRFLAAASPLLSSFRVFVAGDAPETETFVLRDGAGRPQLGIGAVPFLREGDVRVSGLEMSDLDRAGLWERGVLERYRTVERLLREETGPDVPLIAMGHLFVTGKSARSPDGVDPSVYVGSLRNVGSGVFGSGWTYVALGHIHRGFAVESPSPAMFSGSPLALGFNHADYNHRVLLLTIDDEGRLLEPESIPVPQPRPIVRLEGALAELRDGIAGLRGVGLLPAIVEVTCRERAGEMPAGAVVVEDLRRAADAAGVVLGAVHLRETGVEEAPELPLGTLDDLTPEGVFTQVLERAGIPPESRETFSVLFREALEDVLLERAPVKDDVLSVSASLEPTVEQKE